MKNKPLKAIILIILIIGLPLFLAIYEQLFLAYYQETIADKWARYFVIPLLIVSLVFLSIEKYKTCLKSETRKIFQTLKKSMVEVLVLIIMFVYILGPVISGAIIIMNANIGNQNIEIVKGTIIAKRDYNGSRSYEYKLMIKTDSEVLIFDTDIKTITSHHKGDTFKEYMKRGSLGLLYK